jgi:hypothetical protein
MATGSARSSHYQHDEDAELIANLPPSFFDEAGVEKSPYEAARWWLSNDAHHYTLLADPWTAISGRTRVR